MPLTIEMHDPAAHILEELSYPGITQASIAITYAFAIVQQPEADWPKINAAIRARWPSKTGLERVKKAAWKQIDEWRGARNAAEQVPKPENSFTAR